MIRLFPKVIRKQKKHFFSNFIILFSLGKKSSSSPNDRRKTTITGISRRRPTVDYDSFDHAHSAPTSPNLSHSSRQRLSKNPIHIDNVIIFIHFQNFDHSLRV